MPKWLMALQLVHALIGAGQAFAVSCNVPEPGNCYSEGVIVDCSLCDADPLPAPDPARPENADGAVGFSPNFGGIVARPANTGIDNSSPGWGQACKLKLIEMIYKTVCEGIDKKQAEQKAAQKKDGKTTVSQGEAFYRAATADTIGATMKLGEGDEVGASTILVHADEMALRARRSGLPEELELNFLQEGGLKQLSERLAYKSGLTANTVAEKVAQATAGRSQQLPSTVVKSLFKELPEGEFRAKAEEALTRQEMNLKGGLAPSVAAAPRGSRAFTPAFNYERAKSYFEGAGGNFEVSTASPLPAGPSIPKRTQSTAEADRQELSELRSMIRSASLQRIAREPASADDNFTLFQRVSKRIRTLTPELGKKL